MRRNPGNYLGDVRICPAAKWRKIMDFARIFQENPDVRCGEIRASTLVTSKFLRMRNAQKSGLNLQKEKK